MFVVSFTEPSEYIKGGVILFPSQWSLASYKYLLSTNAFLRAIGNSAFLSIVGTALSLIITSGLSYAVSRRRLQGRRIFFLLLILLTTLFNPGIIPPYILVRDLHLINSIWSLILPVLTSGWYVLLMKGFFSTVSRPAWRMPQE